MMRRLAIITAAACALIASAAGHARAQATTPIATCQALVNSMIVPGGKGLGGLIGALVLNPVFSCPYTVMSLMGSFNGNVWTPNIPPGTVTPSMLDRAYLSSTGAADATTVGGKPLASIIAQLQATPANALPISGGTMTGAIQITNGPFDANALSRSIGFEPTVPVIVPNLQEVDVFRISGSYIVGQSSGIGVGGQFAGINEQLTLAPGSDPSANLYALIANLRLTASGGTIKGVYARVDTTLAPSTTTQYSNAFAGVFNVNSGPYQNTIANMQLNAVTNGVFSGVNAKPVNYAIWIDTANPDLSPANYNYGILFQRIAIQAGYAALQAFNYGPGDFLSFKGSASAAPQLFEVNNLGEIGAGMGALGFGSGALNVAGFGIFGTLGGAVQGLIGDSGTGNFEVGSNSAVPLALRANGVDQAFVTSAGLTVTVGLTVGTSANGISIGPSSIARNVANGNLSLAAGTGSSLLSLTGGTISLSSSAVQLPLVPANSTPAASACFDANNNIIKKTTTGSCI